MATVAELIPDHVPRNMVEQYPFVRGALTTERPHDIAQRMHDGPEVFFSPVLFPAGGAWVFRRIATLRALSMDTDHFSSKDFSPFAEMTGGDWTMIPAELDPPVHALFRLAVNPLFTPRAIAALDDKIRLYARQYAQAFKDKGECEFMKDFAFEFPIRVFLELMDMPQDKVEEFLSWEMKMIHGENLAEVQEATQKSVDYLRQEIAARSASPGDDFIGFAIKLDLKGRKLTNDELLGFCFNLFIGGLDTVSTHMGHFFRHLAEHPEDQAKLRADPELIAGAVDELLRAYGSVTTMRTCTRDTDAYGVSIKAGDKVAMSWILAGRDPAEFDSPEEIRFDRKPRHLSLGYGPHLCIGMHLAKRELRIAMEVLLEELPEFRVAPGAEIVSDLGGVVQTQNLPLVWSVA